MLAGGREATLEEVGQRAGTYRLLARLFFKPLSQEEVDCLANAGFDGAVRDSGTASVCEGMNDMARYLRRRNTGTREELACDFTGAFYGVVTREGRSAVPCESLFRRVEGGEGGVGLLMGAPRGEAYRTFKANRVRLAAGLDMPEDHLSFILDYLALLCDRTAECVRTGDAAAARTLLDEQEAFLAEHVTSWFPDFLALAEQIVTTRFYRGVLKLTGNFADEEPGAIERARRALAV